MVALFAGLCAWLYATKRAVAPNRILRLKAPATKPFGLCAALLGSGPRPLGICTWISTVPNATARIRPIG